MKGKNLDDYMKWNLGKEGNRGFVEVEKKKKKKKNNGGEVERGIWVKFCE